MSLQSTATLPTLPRLKSSLKSKETFVLLAATFQALGDTSRVQIVWALTQRELCVGEIAELLGMSQLLDPFGAVFLDPVRPFRRHRPVEG